MDTLSEGGHALHPFRGLRENLTAVWIYVKKAEIARSKKVHWEFAGAEG